MSMTTMNQPQKNIPKEKTSTVDNQGLFPGQHWGVQHHADPLELHGSKKSPRFKDNDEELMLVEFHRAFAWQLINNQWLLHETREGNNNEEGIEERYQAVTAP